MNLKNTIKQYARLSVDTKYQKDDADYSFRKHMLILVNKLVENEKETAKQIKYMWQTLDELKESA